jgi:hypothetical protein
VILGTILYRATREPERLNDIERWVGPLDKMTLQVLKEAAYRGSSAVLLHLLNHLPKTWEGATSAFDEAIRICGRREPDRVLGNPVMKRLLPLCSPAVAEDWQKKIEGPSPQAPSPRRSSPQPR